MRRFNSLEEFQPNTHAFSYASFITDSLFVPSSRVTVLRAIMSFFAPLFVVPVWFGAVLVGPFYLVSSIDYDLNEHFALYPPFVVCIGKNKVENELFARCICGHVFMLTPRLNPMPKRRNRRRASSPRPQARLRSL